MKIILHIGAWKTGSSAIQLFMSEAQEALRAHGAATFADASSKDGQQLMLRRLCEPDEEAAKLVAEIEGFKAAGVQTFVLSNEHFWPLPMHSIQKMGERLGAISDDVRVLIYIRPQDEMWRSLYAQQAKKFYVRTGAALWGTNDFLPSVFAERALHYHQTLQLFADVFGQEAIAVRHYDRGAFAGGDIVTDFLSFLGLDWTKFERRDRDVNRSAGWKGVAFAIWLADEVATAFRERNPREALNLTYFRTVSYLARKFDDGDWFGRGADPLTTEDKAAIRAHYEADNQLLYRVYFNGVEVFPPPAEGRGDPVAPGAVPKREMNVAKRQFRRFAVEHGYKLDGVEDLFTPQPLTHAKPRQRPLSNIWPFRAQKH